MLAFTWDDVSSFSIPKVGVFFEELDGKYFWLCGAHMASVVCFLFFLIIYVAI